MNLEEVNFSFDYQTKYFLHSISKPKSTWMLLHGYGQLARDFAVSFELLCGYQISRLVPEGLSHFYNRRSSSKVGASWMTSEQRELDIQNTMNYLSTVCQHSRLQPDLILGFSQGAEAACRFALRQDIKILVIWCGRLAEETLEGDQLQQLQQKKIIYVCGLSDMIMSREKQEKDLETYKSLNLNIEVLEFDGGHEIHSEVLEEIICRVS